jgi:predicted 3-demethylubiquinone-9 3-methyltransferase (glyoxalase superfamily)
MQKITTFLTFDDQAEEAVRLYTSVFKNSRILSQSRYGEAGPGRPGSIMTMSFALEGQEFVALNGGPSFKFCEGISLQVTCETQKEVDEVWTKLTAGGGKPGPCGWLTDRFGVSWQIVPRVLSVLLNDKDPAKANRVMKAMLQMGKLEIDELTQAYEEESELARGRGRRATSRGRRSPQTPQARRRARPRRAISRAR